MRVTIDYTSAVRQRAGVGRYTRNLVAALAEVDQVNSYRLFCAGDAPAQLQWPANFALNTTPVPERVLIAGWHKLRLPIPVEWGCRLSRHLSLAGFYTPSFAQCHGGRDDP